MSVLKVYYFSPFSCRKGEYTPASVWNFSLSRRMLEAGNGYPFKTAFLKGQKIDI